MQPTQATATGKLILFGEHAVVYHQPAIAVPLTSIGVQATIATAPTSRLQITSITPNTEDTPHIAYYGEAHAEPALINPVEIALSAAGISTPPALDIRITSTIPLASGFGSGAALSKAIIELLLKHIEGEPPQRERLNQLVYEAEKVHHGTPSGIDNTVIVFEEPVYFVRGAPIAKFNIHTPFQLVVAHVGHATPTHMTVGAVGELFRQEPTRIGGVFNEIGEIVQTARTAIEQGYIDKLGSLMNENHRHLQTLTVSDPTLDHLCDAALRAGALGAKLSGGGRGGNMIALVEDATRENVKAALYEAGAANVFDTIVANSSKA